MIFNYIKLAWRVLGRKKFFTAISLFGISFTLAILMIISAYMQTELGNAAPMVNGERLVHLPMIQLKKEYFDTIPKIDTSYLNKVAIFDTTYSYKSNGSSSSSSDMSKQILLTHFSDIPSVESASFFNESSFDVFVNNSKLNVNARFTDADYWNIFNFDFIEGRPYDQSELDQNSPIMVITQKMAKKYFGQENDIIGRNISMDNVEYKIIGLVETPKCTPTGAGSCVSSDVFIPYTLISIDYTEQYYFGGFKAVFMSKSNQSVDLVKDDIIHASQQISLDHPDNSMKLNQIVVKPMTNEEYLARAFYYEELPSDSLKMMRYILFGLISLFILLPMLNLVNLNVSRIMDRASEIGVRKAFGANKIDILLQFVFENIILTLLGGIIGFIMAAIGMYLINDNGILGSAVLSINPQFFLNSLLTIIAFGIISGIIPAFKMSKLQIVHALKQNNI